MRRWTMEMMTISLPDELKFFTANGAEPLAAIDASELGLPPGKWPRRIRILQDGKEIGNGQVFIPLRAIWEGHGYRYQQANGILLLDILND
jgi:hypothetical protein